MSIINALYYLWFMHVCDLLPSQSVIVYHTCFNFTWCWHYSL